MNFEAAKEYILNKLSSELADDLYYHGLHHTKRVYKATKLLADLEQVNGQDRILLETAALYHDAGYIEKYTSNEDVAIRYARESLPRFDYSPAQIEAVCRIIDASDPKQNPKGILEHIMCDADHYYFGENDFHEVAESLRLELKKYGYTHTKEEWDTIQLTYLENHQFYTRSAKETHEQEKHNRLEEIRRRNDNK